jgi:hypothetical protein
MLDKCCRLHKAAEQAAIRQAAKSIENIEQAKQGESNAIRFLEG